MHRRRYVDFEAASFGVSPIDTHAVDLRTHPRAAQVRLHTARTRPGDVLFIPIRWWHLITSQPTNEPGRNVALTVQLVLERPPPMVPQPGPFSHDLILWTLGVRERGRQWGARADMLCVDGALIAGMVPPLRLDSVVIDSTLHGTPAVDLSTYAAADGLSTYAAADDLSTYTAANDDAEDAVAATPHATPSSSTGGGAPPLGSALELFQQLHSVLTAPHMADRRHLLERILGLQVMNKDFFLPAALTSADRAAGGTQEAGRVEAARADDDGLETALLGHKHVDAHGIGYTRLLPFHGCFLLSSGAAEPRPTSGDTARGSKGWRRRAAADAVTGATPAAGEAWTLSLPSLETRRLSVPLAAGERLPTDTESCWTGVGLHIESATDVPRFMAALGGATGNLTRTRAALAALQVEVASGRAWVWHRRGTDRAVAAWGRRDATDDPRSSSIAALATLLAALQYTALWADRLASVYAEPELQTMAAEVGSDGIASPIVASNA